MNEVSKKLFIFGMIFFLLMSISGIYSLQSTVDNKLFSTSLVNIEVKEYTLNSENKKVLYNDSNKNVMPGEEISLISQICNFGADCYIRAKIIVHDDENSNDLDYIKGISDNWNLYGDYYYYNSILESGSEVKLFDTVKVPNDISNDMQTEQFSIKVLAEAVQSQNFKPDYTLEDPWYGIEIEECVNKSYSIGNSGLGLTVKYENNSNRDITIPESLFDELGKLMPGNKFKDLVEIKNNTNKEMEYILSITNNGLNEKEQELLSKVKLKIINHDNQTIYEGDLLKNYTISLGKYLPNEDKYLSFEISIPSELDNEYTQMNIHTIWTFLSKENKNNIAIGSSASGASSKGTENLPKTGDFQFELSIIIFFISSIGLIVVLYLSRKEKKNIYRNK